MVSEQCNEAIDEERKKEIPQRDWVGVPGPHLAESAHGAPMGHAYIYLDSFI
jgi:hypothetical protein